MAEELYLPFQVDNALRSIHLGVLAGVPIDEARRIYPVSSKSMDLWRAGHLELCDVEIEGMENPLEFYRRGLGYLLSSLEGGLPKLVIATTSVMILLDNLHRMYGPGPGEGYRVREYKNSELLELEFLDVHEKWLKVQADKYC